MKNQLDPHGKKKKWFIGAGGIAFLILAAFFLGRIWLDESLYTHKGTLSWYIAVPALMKDVPVVAPVDRPVYYSSAGDGMAPIQHGITYQSKGKRSEVLEVITQYFIRHNFQHVPESSTLNIVLKNQQSSVNIEIQPGIDGMATVKVRQTY